MPTKKKVSFQGAIPFECSDKVKMSLEPPMRHPLSLKRGNKVQICGETNRGKSSLVKSFMIFSSPEHDSFKKIFIIHGAEAHTTEYELIDHTKITMVNATPEFFAAQSKEIDGEAMCLICDDISWEDHNKIEKQNAYKIVQFIATHMNLTCLFVSHTYVALPPRIRRNCDVLCIYPPLGDYTQAQYIARGLGVSKPLLIRAFKTAARDGRYAFVLRESCPPEWRTSWRISGYKPFDTRED